MTNKNDKNDKKMPLKSNNPPVKDMIENLKANFEASSTADDDNGSSNNARLSIASSDQLSEALAQGKIGSFSASSPFALCLLPLLQAIGWRGQIRTLFEALPHFANGLTLTEFRNTLAHMNFRTTFTRITADLIDDRLIPCLFVQKNKGPMVLLGRDEEGLKVYDSDSKEEIYVDETELTGTAYFLSTKYRSQTNKADEEGPSNNFIGDLLWRFKSSIYQLLILTFILNITALIVPLFIMSIYDQVIPSKSLETLGYLTFGIVFAIVCEIGLRMVRAKYIAYFGARIENIIANSTLKKLLSLPPSMTESSPIGGQVSRLKEFDSIKELFSGTMVNVLMELPFLVIFLTVITILGGPIAYVPLGLVVLFAITGFLIIPTLKRAVAETGRFRSKKHSFLVETLSNLRTIKQSGAEQAWNKRYREISANSAYSHFKTAQISLFLQSLAQALMMGAGVATMGLGVLRVIEGDMTIGALIACMALVWRVLSPLQGLFLALTRLEQTLLSVKQINQVMRIKEEQDPDPESITQRKFAGQVTFSNVSFRYQPDKDPALMGLAFSVEPGEILGIMGNNASGKSTILKMILAMHRPQGGQIFIDGLDMRQLNPVMVRQSIAYVPQKVDFFHGTIAQNLRLSHPMASDEELEEACDMANALDEINSLPDGLNTRIGDQNIQSLATSFKQRISLARAYLKKSEILLLDEPAQTLDYEGDAAFMKSLQQMKGKCTIIMVSHRPSHLKLCDKILVMEDGQPRALGTPDEIFPPREGKRA